jgi:hypothetical protein
MSANSKNLRDETAHQGYGLEDSEKLVRFENINQNREGNGKLSQESAFESYNHQDFDSLVQDESQMKKSIKIHSESAFKNYNHQDFDDLVRNEKTSENNIKVLGVSADNVKSHDKFATKFALPFPLLADEDKTVIQKFGVWGPKKFMGREYEGIHRVSFVMDENGVIIHVIQKPKTKDHAKNPWIAEFKLKRKLFTR